MFGFIVASYKFSRHRGEDGEEQDASNTEKVNLPATPDVSFQKLSSFASHSLSFLLSFSIMFVAVCLLFG